jgi:hypothetical protein
MSEELLPQQNRIDLISAELDIKRKEPERRDQEFVEEAAQGLVAVGLSGHRARRSARALLVLAAVLGMEAIVSRRQFGGDAILGD